MSATARPVGGPVTRVVFDRIGRVTKPLPLEVPGELVAFDVVDAVHEYAGPISGAVVLEVVVDLPDGARHGRVYLSDEGNRRLGEGRITVTTAEDAAGIVVTYPDGQSVAPGDVVTVGRVGSAFHVVTDVAIGLVRLREAGPRRREQTVDPGRLRLVERGGLP